MTKSPAMKLSVLAFSDYYRRASFVDGCALRFPLQELGKDVVKTLSEDDSALIQAIFRDVTKKALRFVSTIVSVLFVHQERFSMLILDNNMRCDGRGIREIRPITINVDIFKRLHGSSMFQRGQTQVCCIAFIIVYT